jgi:hypothetical protein
LPPLPPTLFGCAAPVLLPTPPPPPGGQLPRPLDIQSLDSPPAAGVPPFFDDPKPGGGPDVDLPIADGAAHKSDVESDQLLVLAPTPNFGIVLAKFCCVGVVGLKLHVEDDNVISFGDVLAAPPPNKSDSLAALIDSGLRATEPGVILGSSSTFFCVP